MEVHNNVIGINNNLSSEFSRMDTKVHSVNKDLERVAHGLKELNRQKDAFISIAAHELKTPITSIQGFAQLLQDEKLLADIEKSMHYVNLINKNTERLYHLIRNLIDSFKILNNALVLNIVDTNLNDILEEIKESTKNDLKDKDLTADFYIQENLPIVRTDHEKIIRILKNLISNSIKFTDSGIISLRIIRDGNFVRFEVKDTGQGIPQESHEFIFSNFYQVDTSMARKVGGVGLGLFICKGLVESLNGKIWFDSKLGKGSVFYFTIPIENEKINKKE
ncbi:MAG TPA: HAMP domain-containing sensor histidine kinase [Alphaproteobacteria bacterium]|nr:HAMP domain-containing sensor histidine kinase [Alphaproteobacteria bacterium]